MKIQLAILLLPLIAMSCGNCDKTSQGQVPTGQTQVLPFSPFVEANNTLYISGQISPNKEGETKTIEQETREVMGKIGEILRQNGYSFNDVVRCSVFLDDIDNYHAVNKVYASFYEGKFPSRVAMEVSRLVKGSRIEISAIAVKGKDVQGQSTTSE
ncbi:MAG: RidA family protein [Chlorobi bacterium]|nr:RidA family protein [Chlorobiota bacterium]